jgi:hypothetical protein
MPRRVNVKQVLTTRFMSRSFQIGVREDWIEARSAPPRKKISIVPSDLFDGSVGPRRTDFAARRAGWLAAEA